MGDYIPIGLVIMVVGGLITVKTQLTKKVDHPICEKRRVRVSDEITKVADIVNNHTGILERLDERSENMQKTLDKMNGGRV